MRLNKPGVIVIGGHVQGLGIIRIFGKNKIPTILLDDTHFNISRFSKFCSKFLYFRKQQLLEKLISLAQNNLYNGWVLIPTNDYHVKILSQNHKTLSEYFKVSTDKWESISICYNKINTYKTAYELNITIPKTYFPENLDEINTIDISFPCIIKPAIMHEFYSKIKKKVFVCNTQNELIFYYKKAISIIPKNQIIVQEIIEGTSDNQFSVGFLFENGKTISTLTARRKRQHPIDFGNATTFAEIIEIPELFEKGERILNHIHYNGICEVEFKKSAIDGKYYFLEINPRTWKWHSIAVKAGIHFLINQYNHLCQLDYLENSKPNINICWKHIVTDTFTVIKLLQKKQYSKSKCKITQYAVWDKSDIWPSIFEILLLPFLIFKR